MSEPKLHDEMLQRLLDDDLDDQQAGQVREALQGDPEAQRGLQQFEQLGRLMRVAGEELQAQADPDAMFERIQAQITADGADGKADAARSAGAKSGLPSLFDRWFGSRAWVPAAGALAVTAAVLMTVYRPVKPGDLAAPSHLDERAPESEQTPTEAQPQEAEATASDGSPASAIAVQSATGSEVIQVDFGNHAGTVFDVALSNGSSTAVIWINDEE